MTRLSSRPGTTLVELMLFLALIAMASGAVIGFLFLTADARLRQQVSADLEQVSAQLQQQLLYEIRGDERVLLPARGQTGSVLALQAASPDGSPVILAVISGALVLVRGADSYPLTPAAVSVEHLSVTNVSASDALPGVDLSLTLKERVLLPDGGTATMPFSLSASLLPQDDPQGDTCGCTLPVCNGGTLQWATCLAGTCSPVGSFPISCP